MLTLLDSSSEDDDEDSVLQRAGSLLTGKADHLPCGMLDITRIKDANMDKPSNVSQKLTKRLYYTYRLWVANGKFKTLRDGESSVFFSASPKHFDFLNCETETYRTTQKRRLRDL